MAGERKFETYGELAQALRQLYCGAEWRVEILPWVVGVRGILDTVGIGPGVSGRSSTKEAGPHENHGAGVCPRSGGPS